MYGLGIHRRSNARAKPPQYRDPLEQLSSGDSESFFQGWAGRYDVGKVGEQHHRPFLSSDDEGEVAHWPGIVLSGHASAVWVRWNQFQIAHVDRPEGLCCTHLLTPMLAPLMPYRT